MIHTKNTGRIGITERGDAGLDLSWQHKMNTVDGAIVITKCLANQAFKDAILQYKDRLILHACITGNGGTIYEPNVLPAGRSLDELASIIHAGFPTDHIVLRCDPIIPTQDGLANMEDMLRDFLSRSLGITRIRISVLDNYPHVRQRFADAGLPVLYGGAFQAPDAVLDDISKRLTTVFKGHPEITLECCAEPRLADFAAQYGRKRIMHSGCCSMKDIHLLGIRLPSSPGVNPQHRSGCLCITAKKELLSHPAPCPHKCIYCYWKDR